jgi:hypothetical protein
MKELTAEQLTDNWNKLIQIIEDTFPSPRKEKLLEMYNHFEDRIVYMPASGKEHFHNCFPGGYVEHVLNVINCAQELFMVWERLGGTIDYTKEELIFVALNHDLGKVGSIDQEAYRPNPSEWHRKNQGALYEFNPDNPFIPVPDNSLFLLQQFSIPYTFNEHLGIKLHDGLYDDGNKPYFISYQPQSKLRTHLPILMHQADHMASRIEYEQWFGNKQNTITPAKVANTISGRTTKTKQLEAIAKNTKSTNASRIFDELFKS